jgi:hypothetical protein
MMLVLVDGACGVMELEGSSLGLSLGSIVGILLGLEEVGVDVVGMVVVGRELGTAVGYAKNYIVR